MPGKVVLVSGVRTAVGKFGFGFKDVPVQRLGSIVVKEAVKRSGLQLHDIEEVIMGNVVSAGLGLASESRAQELGIKPRAKIIDYTTSGTKPENVMEAPIFAVRKLLGKTGFSIDEIDLIEHNEAYATASIAIAKELDITPEKLNVFGGAIALGHPIGCSGARLLVTLLHALEERKLKRGLATLCLGGGNAVAMII